jgi:hypothetical protein
LFYNQTVIHVPDFQFLIIRAVDIFQCFCRAVPIRAVDHFGLKHASARNPSFFDFRAVFIFMSSARTVSSSWDFGVEQFFRADEFWAVDPSLLSFGLGLGQLNNTNQNIILSVK